MLLTIAGGALYSLHDALLAQTMLAMVTVYGVGVAAAGLWNLTAGKPVPLLYVAFWGVLTLLSALFVGCGGRTSGNRAR
jgi:hypothetical protein